MRTTETHVKNLIPNKIIIMGLMLLVFTAAMFTKLYYFSSIKEIVLFPDSFEYLDTSEKIAMLKMDSSRVPVYPLFIQLAKHILPWYEREMSVVYLQILISSIGIAVLFYISFSLFNRNLKAIIISLFTVGNIWLLNWDTLVLTESFTIFMVLIFLLLFVLYIRTKLSVFLILIYVMNGLLIFLKPFYLFLPVVVFATLVLQNLIDGYIRKRIIIGFVSIITIYLCVFSYSWLNFMHNGYFGISNVGAINTMGKILQYRMYELSDNERIKEYVKMETELKGGEILEPVAFIYKYGLEKNNYEEVSEFCGKIIKQNPHIFLKGTLDLVFQKKLYQWQAFCDYNVGNYIQVEPPGIFNYINKVPFINTFGFIFLIIMVDLMYIVYAFIKKHQYKWVWALISLLVIYQVVMSIVGAHGEYNRLIVPIYVLMYLIIFKYLFMIFDVVGLKMKKLISNIC